MSIDNIVKSAFVAGFAFFLSLAPLKKIYSQGEPEWKTVTTKTQLFKSDSSSFGDDEAFVDVQGNDIEDSTKGYFIIGDEVPADGYVELTFDIYTRMPAPNGVVDVKQGFLPEDYAISNPYPQPVNDHTKIDVSSPERTKAIISLCDIKGEGIYSESLDLERAINVIELSGVQDLPPSVYFIYVTGADNSFLLAQKMLRMDPNTVYSNNLFKSSDIHVDGNYDFNVVGKKPYVDPSPDSEPVFKGNGVDGETVSDKIGVQWSIPGFGSDHVIHDLWEWNDLTGTYDFQDVIIDTFLLPYPSSTPGLKFDPEGKRTLDVDKNYFQTDPNINFQYKSDAKKE